MNHPHRLQPIPYRKQQLAVVFCLMLCGAAGADPIRIVHVPSATDSRTSLAVRVMNADLVQSTQLSPKDSSGDLPAQIADVLEQLEAMLKVFSATRSDVVKLNLYVRDAQTQEAVLEQLADWFPENVPAVAGVSTTLPDAEALVALDAVFVSRREKATANPERVRVTSIGGNDRLAHACVMPRGDVIYISGQAEPGEFTEATRATLEGLLRTLQDIGLDRQHIVQIKTFFRPMTEAAVVNQQIVGFFGDGVIPPVSHVEWISEPWPIEIELVAWAPAESSDETVTYSTPPWMQSSPVYSKVARIHGDDRIYVAGLTSPEAGNAEEQVHGVFGVLEGVLNQAGSDLTHMAKATYYISDDDSAGALNALRPEYYDPQRPPAASKAVVIDVATRDRSLTLDMIAAPTSSGE